MTVLPNWTYRGFQAAALENEHPKATIVSAVKPDEMITRIVSAGRVA